MKIQLRRDTAANWTSVNPTLASGEIGVETDTLLWKMGDGTTAWNSLAYTATTPYTHASSHATGGDDELTPADIGACADDDARLTDSRDPTAHASTHATAGSDPLTPADIGACADDDARLSDSRDPTAHASTHATAGSDPLTPADIGAIFLLLGTTEAGNENTTTLKTSATLQASIPAGTWCVEAFIAVDGNASYASAGTRQKLAFSGTGTWAGVVYATDNSSATSNNWPTAKSVGTAVDTERLASGSSSATYRLGVLTASTSGTVSVQFAQRTATAAASPSLAAGSFLRLTTA